MRDIEQLVLAEIQGRLFANSARRGFESEAFVETFMNSRLAAYFDLPYDRSHWAGEAWLMETLVDEAGGSLKQGKIWDSEILFWMGYTYRAWHFHNNDSSRKIAMLAPPLEMARGYPGLHTLYYVNIAERFTDTFSSQAGKKFELAAKRLKM